MFNIPLCSHFDDPHIVPLGTTRVTSFTTLLSLTLNPTLLTSIRYVLDNLLKDLCVDDVVVLGGRFTCV